MTSEQMTCSPTQRTQNKDFSTFMRFSLEAGNQGGPSKGRLDLFGYVGGNAWFDDGFNEKTVRNYLTGLSDTDPLEVWINSYGGNPYCGLAIYDMLSHHKGPVEIHVCGMAMSAATLITCARNAKVTCSIGSIMMIHEASGFAEGKTSILANAIAELETVNASACRIYCEKTGLPEEQVRELMSKDTFMTAETAKQLGFVDEIEDQNAVKPVIGQDGQLEFNGVRMSMELSRKVPKDFFKPEATASEIQTKEDPMDLEKLKAEHAELVEQIRVEAVATERKRIMAIGELTPRGYEEMAAKAIENGLTPEQFAVDVVKAEKSASLQRAQSRKDDAASLSQVAAQNPPVMVGESEQEKKQAVIKAGADGYRKI